MSFEMQITGFVELAEKLTKMGPKVERRLLGQAMRKVMKPVLDAAKQRVPVDDGDLKRSLTTSTKKLKNGSLSVRVGPDTKSIVRAGKDGSFNFDKRKRPANYAHLVEYGHHSAAATGLSVARTKGTSRRKGTFDARSFVMPQPFLRPAWAAHGGENMVKTFGADLMKRIEREEAKGNA